ncbi:hypothetical protein CPJCM30710_04400 [Clostridium polyendosporum]|uniref:Uncharacterized protein n=1 Tax=Clostridium polyendosporum TaxID=69208 RepID=A0A919RWV6_9CLOT|nr:type II toxin-antitoxin system PemK/MazF family toxin [Clostridium polyendosporum]GIM27774.1 hypothetical protein CPJCM30710_04400 [Clostridium polyendosporum]
MPINKYNQNHVERNLYVNPKLKLNSSVSNELVADRLKYTFNDTKKLLDSANIKDIIPFIIWNDTWNQYGIYGPKKDESYRPQAKLRYSKGRKVFVDFGCGNIGWETSLPHPAFILYNFAKTAVVIPTTSDDGSNFSNEMELSLIRCRKDNNVFPCDSLINLNQIRVISKNRILKDLNCSAQDYMLSNETVDELNSKLPDPIIPYNIDLKQCIEIKIAHLYAKDVFNKMVDYNKQINLNNQSIEKLKDEINELRKENTKLKSRLNNYR